MPSSWTSHNIWSQGHTTAARQAIFWDYNTISWHDINDPSCQFRYKPTGSFLFFYTQKSHEVFCTSLNKKHLTHWGRVTHICVGKLIIIGSNNGLSPGRRQAIIWTNAGIWLMGPLGTNFSEILIEIHTFSFKKMHLKMSYVKWHPFCLGLNVLIWIMTGC